MLHCKDFVPTIILKQDFKLGFTGITPEIVECEDFGIAIKAAGEWLKRSGVKPTQIETVALPNLWKTENAGPQSTSLGVPNSTVEGKGNFWHQFIRIWYIIEEEPADPYR